MELKLDDFIYDLPKDRIASEPLKERSQSKLLHYKKGRISDHTFADLPSLIHRDTLLVFNNTRVIPARMFFYKETGARIELFLLEPTAPSTHEQIMDTRASCQWKCMIGNAKKWKNNTSLTHHSLDLSVTRVGADQVVFQWKDAKSFSEKLQEIGRIPLPPYIDREVNEADEKRYQTVYSKIQGAVAAPTAGLHFTDTLIQQLVAKGVAIEYLTLHVSAGTFQPIKKEKVTEHPMHQETIHLTRENVYEIKQKENIVAVGTTSMRTLESLYWFGVKLAHGVKEFSIHQDDPYQYAPIPKKEALNLALQWMDEQQTDVIAGNTSIYIYPGYEFRVCKGLVTNFHLPGSTLMLLVAAMVGSDWKDIYEHALQNDYRFLSYGDGSFLQLHE